MRVTAIATILSSFFLGLGMVRADVEPVTVPAQPGQTQVNGGSTTFTFDAVAPGGISSATVSNNPNGTREAQSEEYGQKVKITDDPQNGIKIVQTTHKGGTDETKTFEAKDATELEKKSPAAFKLYQKYLGNQAQANAGLAQGIAIAGAPIQIGGGVLQLQAIPAPFPMPGPGIPGMPAIGNVQVIQAQANVVPAGGQAMPIEVVTIIMDQLSGEIESAAKNKSWKDASKDEKAAIKKKAEELKKQLGVLEKQFEEK